MRQVKVGWATRNISTAAAVNIPGQMYMRVSKGLSDPLFCTALVIENGEDAVIFLSIDTTTIANGILDSIRTVVAEKNPEIDVNKIFSNATHTHEAPDAAAMPFEFNNSAEELPPCGVEMEPSSAYRRFLIESAAESICEAYERRSEGGLAYGYGYASVGHSRRVIYFDDTSKRDGAVDGFRVDGHGRMYGDTNDPMFSHFEAGSDGLANFMFTFDSSRKLTGAIINVPCPSQCSEQEHMLSADYWNEVRSCLRAEYGDIFILAQCAAAGDLTPRLLHYKKAQDRRLRLKYGDMEHTRAERHDIAERLAQSFTETLAWAQKDIRTEVEMSHCVKVIELSRRMITDEEYVFAQNGLKELEGEAYRTDNGTPEELLTHNSKLLTQRKRYQRIIERFEQQGKQPKIEMELHVVKVGGAAFASNCYELFMDYMHRIQARSPFEQTFVVQLSGNKGKEGAGYLATQRAAEAKGYSACLFCNTVSPEGGQELVDETVRALKEVYET